jgi:transposase-like protein
MSTKLACSVVPSMEICPNCKSEMTITEVTPIFLADGLEDVTYRCKGCRSEMKRTFKQHSGAWELVTLPSFLHFAHEAKTKTATDANQKQGSMDIT